MDIFETAAKKTIITAHMGVNGATIPANSIKAYKIAVEQGADMIEIDVSKSIEGTLYIMHPGLEKTIGINMRLSQMHDDQLENKMLYTFGGTLTDYPMPKLDEVFEEFKGKCFINVDKFLDNPAEICQCIKRHNIAEQCIVKSSPKPEVLDIVENYAPEIPYLPIISEIADTHEVMMKRNINYIGSELVFDRPDHEFLTENYVEKLHKAGKLAWGNAIVYSYKTVLAAGQSDNSSLAGDPENGWGWLVDNGFDIIQTDWTLAMRLFLEKTGRLYK